MIPRVERERGRKRAAQTDFGPVPGELGYRVSNREMQREKKEQKVSPQILVSTSTRNLPFYFFLFGGERGAAEDESSPLLFPSSFPHSPSPAPAGPLGALSAPLTHSGAIDSRLLKSWLGGKGCGWGWEGTGFRKKRTSCVDELCICYAIFPCTK